MRTSSCKTDRSGSGYPIYSEPSAEVLLGAKRALEVGVFTGYSSLCVALALPRDGQLIACDISKKWTDVARRYWQEGGVADIVELHLAPAIETMDHLLAQHEAGKFDFIFIDADVVNKGNFPSQVPEI